MVRGAAIAGPIFTQIAAESLRKKSNSNVVLAFEPPKFFTLHDPSSAHKSPWLYTKESKLFIGITWSIFRQADA